MRDGFGALEDPRIHFVKAPKEGFLIAVRALDSWVLRVVLRVMSLQGLPKHLKGFNENNLCPENEQKLYPKTIPNNFLGPCRSPQTSFGSLNTTSNHLLGVLQGPQNCFGSLTTTSNPLSCRGSA